MLEIEKVVSGYGAIDILHDVSLCVKDEQIVSIIGGNGAGKSTLLRTISGLIEVRRGKIRFGGEDIASNRAHKIFGLGLVHVPEGRQLFGPLSVYENLFLGCYLRRRSLGRDGIKAKMERIFNIFPVLSGRLDQTASTLSGGEQQMLAIGRGLLADPKLLLLDEPSQGLAPLVVKEIAGVIRGLNIDGISILLVEQNVSIALALAHYVYLLNMGMINAEGKTDELIDNPRVKEIYLGKIRINKP